MELQKKTLIYNKNYYNPHKHISINYHVHFTHTLIKHLDFLQDSIIQHLTPISRCWALYMVSTVPGILCPAVPNSFRAWIFCTAPYQYGACLRARAMPEHPCIGDPLFSMGYMFTHGGLFRRSDLSNQLLRAIPHLPIIKFYL